uniref:Uncharacterized protein n=1 Tax=viral metagenome TaxID=1070528 RepID=A0A6M3KA10_9ZZZZ
MENNGFTKMFLALVAQAKQEDFKGKPIRSLGEVILLLKAQPESNIVRLDFTDDNPGGLISYRGYYEDLCLDYNSNAKPIRVGELLAMFKNAVGSTHTGYKGGDFTMSRQTLVWVAPYGSCGRMLTDIRSKDSITLIITSEDKESDIELGNAHPQLSE